MASQAAGSGTAAPTLIGVLSDDPSSLDDLAAVHPAGISAHVVHLSPEDLAQSAITLRAFDLLVIDDYATDTLTSGQRTGLADFVRDGGALLIGTGASWRKTLAGIPTELVAARPTGTATIATRQALGGPATLELAAGLPGSSAGTWLAEASHPLLIETAVGSGLVTLATFDWNQPAVSAAAGTKALLRQLLVRDLFASAAQQNFPIGIGGGGFSTLYGGAGTSISERSNALSSVLGDCAGSRSALAAADRIAGPGLRPPGRADQLPGAWCDAPARTVLGHDPVDRGDRRRRRVRDRRWHQGPIGPEQPGCHRPPGIRRGPAHTRKRLPASWRPPAATTRSARRARAFSSARSVPTAVLASAPGSTRIDAASNVVTLQGLTAFSLRGFATESVTPAPQLGWTPAADQRAVARPGRKPFIDHLQRCRRAGR